MHIEQLYTNCLAEAAYYIESEGESVVIDPLRETEPYLKKAEERGAKIKYVFETHFHADFVSGHLDLARKTGATIVYGPNADTEYDVHNAKDGEEFQLGKITLKALHTPGHTLESTCYLLKDENGKNHAIFTGDTLFIGDVGRPDLAIGNGLSQEDLAGMMFDSLRNKILPLEDEIIIYPAHGAGSSCGKNLSEDTFDTLGNQRKFNYALQPMSREEFIQKVTEGIAPPPQYFAKDAMINKTGYENVDKVAGQSLKGLSVKEFEQEIQHGGLLLDTREAQMFCKGFIPNSINIGLGGMYAIWVGTLIEDIHQPILIIAEKGKEEEAVMRLARVGYDNAVGYLEEGFEAWKEAGKPVESIHSISAQEFAVNTSKTDSEILDVRKPNEYENAHLEKATTFPLDYIWENSHQLNKSNHYIIHCRTGYRSMIACSILKKEGVENITNVVGGFEAIQQTGLPVVSNIC